MVACLLPAGACPEEPKLGTFGTDRGKDWGEGGLQKFQVFHGYLTHIYVSATIVVLADTEHNFT